MRTTYRRDKKTGEFYEVRRSETDNIVNIIGDIPAYESVITGETIEGRRAHREHLKQHGCQEVGNEGHPSTYKPKDVTKTDEYRRGVRDDIRRAIKDQEYGRAPSLEQLRGMRSQALRDMGLD